MPDSSTSRFAGHGQLPARHRSPRETKPAASSSTWSDSLIYACLESGWAPGCAGGVLKEEACLLGVSDLWVARGYASPCRLPPTQRPPAAQNRWHTGLLLWKTKRHRHTVEQARRPHLDGLRRRSGRSLCCGPPRVVLPRQRLVSRRPFSSPPSPRSPSRHRAACLSCLHPLGQLPHQFCVQGTFLTLLRLICLDHPLPTDLIGWPKHLGWDNFGEGGLARPEPAAGARTLLANLDGESGSDAKTLIRTRGHGADPEQRVPPAGGAGGADGPRARAADRGAPPKPARLHRGAAEPRGA